MWPHTNGPTNVPQLLETDETSQSQLFLKLNLSCLVLRQEGLYIDRQF